MSPIQPFRLRRYWPAWLTLVLGLAASGGLAMVLHRQAEELDKQRFKLEADHLAALLEKKMERYEERLARLADHCALFKELPEEIWTFRALGVTDLDGNLPAAVHAVYCLHIRANEFPEHAARGRAVWRARYSFDPDPRPGRDLALPVWQRWWRAGFHPILRGTDMAEETANHPSLRRGLGHRRGGVSAAPVRVARTNGAFENGFWFSLALFKADQARVDLVQTRDESPEDFQRRQANFYRDAAIGILAVFVSTDLMVDEGFNNEKTPHRLHVRLYASREPRPENSLNPGSPAPAHPRHREVIVQAWYGRRWALEFNSTPLFEADSGRHRSWLVLGAGTGMTVLASALLGVTLRARNRQELLTEQIREARDALAAAQQEREKFSRDLHDGTIQSLYAIQLGLGHTVQRLEAEPASARRELDAVRSELDTVIAEIRRFITVEESAGKAVDFCGVLRALVERARAGTTAQIEVRCDPGADDDLSGAEAVQLANITREALSNGLRHAKPQRMEIALRSERGTVVLEISDDGVGFDPTAPARRGAGLASMAARAQEMGGTLDIQSSPGRGTQVVVRVPVSSPNASEQNGRSPQPTNRET